MLRVHSEILTDTRPLGWKDVHDTFALFLNQKVDHAHAWAPPLGFNTMTDIYKGLKIRLATYISMPADGNSENRAVHRDGVR